MQFFDLCHAGALPIFSKGSYIPARMVGGKESTPRNGEELMKSCTCLLFHRMEEGYQYANKRVKQCSKNPRKMTVNRVHFSPGIEKNNYS